MTERARRQDFAPAGDSYDAIVGALERVEVEARERRLTAQSEADRIRAAAHTTAVGIAAGVPAQITAALAEQRARHLDLASAEVATVEARLAADRSVATVTDAAVDLLVAAVLAERVE